MTVDRERDREYDLLRGLQDLDLHLLLAEKPLEVANPLMSLPHGSQRDDVLVRGHGLGATGPYDFRGNSPMRPSRPAATGYPIGV